MAKPRQFVEIICRWKGEYRDCDGIALPYKKSCRSCLDKRNIYQSKHKSPSRTNEYYQKLKREAFEAYGGPICACCGEKEYLFLSIDHVNNDGNLHRRSLQRRGVRYHQLKRAGWPNNPPLQVLCMNCNWGKDKNGGICPHVSKRLMLLSA